MRLQKFLSQAGVASRRQAENLIAEGRIQVNQKTVVEMGTQVDPTVDHIQFDKQVVTLPEQFKYLLFNKPEGYLVTRSDTHGRPTIYDLLPAKYHELHPVGRLDQNSCGLLLLTNDGEWTQHLLHPKFKVEKSYEVHVVGKVTPRVLKRLSRPMNLQGTEVRGAQVSILKRHEQYTALDFRIKEGKKRQIRRMCSTCHLTVTFLQRRAFGALELRDLPEGQFQELSVTLLNKLKLK